jgi:predicted nucleic acid-binding protein
LLEVFKRLLQQRSESDALQAVAVMQQGQVVGLDAPLALSAAKLGVESKLPLADSIVMATARQFGATLWTQDEDFQGLPGVNYRPKRK